LFVKYEHVADDDQLDAPNSARCPRHTNCSETNAKPTASNKHHIAIIIASRDPKGNKAPAGATQSTTVAKRFATRSRLRLSEASLHPLAQRLGNRDVGEAAARGHG
jgi:hypothetical protein